MGCSETAGSVKVTERAFGTTKDGKEVTLFELSNTQGMTVGIINYGGVITIVVVPDKHGIHGDVVLGHENLRSYEEDGLYFGCITGRFANRIAPGKIRT